jgi:cytochrome P450
MLSLYVSSPRCLHNFVAFVTVSSPPQHRSEQASKEARACLTFDAGFETTAHSVAWGLYEIARNREVQSKLAAELEAAGLLWAPGRPGRALEYADLASLPYVNQVL